MSALLAATAVFVAFALGWWIGFDKASEISAETFRKLGEATRDEGISDETMRAIMRRLGHDTHET